jgi:beta-lactam-binding protein with PASTA domain
VGRTRSEAEALLAELPARADFQPATAGAESRVVEQSPPPGVMTPGGSLVTVRLLGPVPAVEGMARPAAEAALQLAGLAMAADPADAAAEQVASAQDPEAGGAIPADRTVKVTFGPPGATP